MSTGLSREDYESVRRAGQVLHERGWRKAFTANEMTDAWAQLIRAVAQGYEFGVDEYINDLSCRDWLAAAWPLFTERVRMVRQEELAALDERFRAATIEDGGQALSHSCRVKSGWWWRRRPALLVGELARDFRTVGVA